MADVKRLLNGNLEISFSLPWADIKKAYDTAVDQAVAQATLTGFRKGKAPRHLVEPKLDKEKLYSAALQALLPQAYSQIIKDQGLHPILNPRISITSGQTGREWRFTALTSESPAVTLPDYKSGLKQLSLPPGADRLNGALEYLHRETPVKVPDLLVEEEANHRLAALIDNISRLGLSPEDYLKTKKLTPESLKAQTSSEARSALEVEFILAELQKTEKLPDRKSVLDFLQNLV